MRSNLLTHSRLAASRRCPRLHHYLYNEGIRPVKVDEVLRFGTLMASMKEAYRKAWVGSDPLGAAHAVLGAVPEEQCDPFVREQLLALIDGYDARWRDEDVAATVRFIAVEAWFEHRLRNPATGYPSQTFLGAGKVDAIQSRFDRDTDGVLVVEDKTSSEDIAPGSEYWRRLRIDGQVSQYIIGAETIIGRPVEGVLYDVIGKPGQRPLKATPEESRKYTKAGTLYAAQRASDETPAEYGARIREHIAANPDSYYQRMRIVRLDEELREYQQEVWWEADLIRERANKEVHPRNPDGCRQYGRLCSFFDVCTRSASIDDPYLFRKVENVHPELEETSVVPHDAQ